MTQLRIVSLVPSITELVCHLGRSANLVGRTRFCTDPADVLANVPIIGGTKNPIVERIVRAEPGLVIANREENRREDVEALEGAGLRVMLTDPNDVPGAIEMILDLGRALDSEAAAEALVAEIREALAAVETREAVDVLVPIWLDPLMCMGTGTYGNDLLARCGGRNVVTETRYPEMSLAQAAGLHPRIVILPDEPFPFAEKHVPEFANVAPAQVIDGKLLWWYGPRMASNIRQLREILREGRH